jgi:Skp family chaperone for outer membrane proteins
MKAKPILFVVVTLLIGFVLGMLTSAQIRFNRLKPVRLYFSEDRFREGLYKTLEPDEKQKAEIEKILDKYAALNSELQSSLRKGLDSNMKELRKELESKLTKEQLARLKEMDERRQEMIRQGRRNRRDDSTEVREFKRGDHDGRFSPGGRQMPPPEKPPYNLPDTSRLPDNK